MKSYAGKLALALLITAPLLASQTGGTGITTNCNGGPPYYCAPTWATTMGGFTPSDGTCSWVLLGLYGQPFAGPVWNGGGHYQAAAYIVDAAGGLQEETDAACISGATAPLGTGTHFDGGCHWNWIEATGLTTTPAWVATRMDVFAVRLR